MTSLLILLGKSLSTVSKRLNLGHGSTWPGHIALSVNKNFIKNILRNSKTKIILIAGTNGKTTTSTMIRSILEQNGNTVLQNESGANLLNGIASTLLLKSSPTGKITQDYAIFEVDENSLPLVLKELTPDYLILLNLFRDQLDRYGEVNAIASKWHKAVKQLSSETTLILNADDPQIAWIGMQKTQSKVFYFGLDDPGSGKKHMQHAVDSTYCPNCSHKLTYKTNYYSHLGDWYCPNCKEKRPTLDAADALYFPLAGMYNRYNTIAAVFCAKLNNVTDETIQQSLKEFKPAFGRQEIINIDGKHVQLFLSKNPTSFNESLRAIMDKKVAHILFVLNDRIPDGRDVSWIWDVDFEEYLKENVDVSVAGDRAYDMALRLKYAHPAVKKVYTYFPLLEKGVHKALAKVPKGETLYVLPTYSAMLEVRKVLTGKKIL
jgi:UDP-N-acetylmuramyl tripeptide synthase